MARKSKGQQQTLSGSPIGNFTNFSPKPIQANRAPTTEDTGFEIGQLWADSTNDIIYALSSVSAGAAQWNLLGGGTGDVDVLDGDTGTAIPSGGVITIAGGDGLTTVGAGSTVTINRDEKGGYPITPFVVGDSGEAGFQTIQSGINAAKDAGGGVVYIQPGSYTEDLLLSNAIDLHGAIPVSSNEGFSVTITGTHTPPNAGKVGFRSICFIDTTAVFSSAAAGSTHLMFLNCESAVQNGYFLDLQNWTGTLELFDHNPNTAGTPFGIEDGGINNSGGSTVLLSSGGLGFGTSNVLTVSGPFIAQSSEINPPSDFISSASVSVKGVSFNSNTSLSNSSSGSFDSCSWNTGASPSINITTSGDFTISNSSINTSNNPAITGAITGSLDISATSFLNNREIGVTGTLTSSELRGAGQISRFVVGTSPDAPYQTIQSAITAANTAGGGTVYIQNGAFTEDLTLFADVHMVGASRDGVTIAGSHTLPTSGTLSFSTASFSDATDIFSGPPATGCTFLVENCDFDVVSGHTFDGANFNSSCSIEVQSCICTGTNDGFFDNFSGQATLTINSSKVGVGGVETLTVSRFFTVTNSTIVCEIAAESPAIFLITGSFLERRFTSNGTSAGSIIQTITQSITMDSSLGFNLLDCTVATVDNPAIDGSGAGVITLMGCSFLGNAELAGTLTFASGEVRGAGQVSRFVVGTAPDSPYQTIQDALDAADADGGGLVYVKDGAFTENLTMFDNVNIQGASRNDVTIVGTHTPPSSGNFSIRELTLSSSTDIFFSAAAGSTTITLDSCEVSVVNGHVFDVPNWVGTLQFNSSISTGVDDGFVSNNGGAVLVSNSSLVGAGTGNNLITSGPISFTDVIVNCPSLITAGSLISGSHNTFNQEVTFAGTSSGTFSHCSFLEASDPSITMNSSGDISIPMGIIDTVNSPAVDGSGAGTLNLSTCTFESNTLIGASVNLSAGNTKTGDLSIIIPGSKLEVEGGTATDFIGTATLAAGTVTVANTNIAANDRIFISYSGSPLANSGELTSSIIASTSFTIDSTDGADANTVSYFIVRQL